MRFLALLLLGVGVAGPALAEVEILRGSSAPPAPPPAPAYEPPPQPQQVIFRETVYVPVYYLALPYVVPARPLTAAMPTPHRK